jgi:chromosome segregation ATPase
VQAELQRLAEDLGIAETDRGWVLDTSILAPEQKRRYTLESHRIQVAQKVAYEMGLEGKPDVAWRALSRRVAEITGEKIHEAWFAPSGRGAHFREHIEAAFADGVAERNRKIEQVASELGEIVEEVAGATNGNGYHLDEEPTEEDLSLVEEVAKLEVAIEEYQDRIKALEAQLADSAPTQVQTLQPDTGGTLEGILAALQTQLEDASSKAEAAAKAVELAQEQAELAELGVDQARQRLQAALEAVNTLQALKEGE